MYEANLKEMAHRKMADVEVAQSRYRGETDACTNAASPVTFTMKVIERLNHLTAELSITNGQLSRTIARNIGGGPPSNGDSVGMTGEGTQSSVTFPAIMCAIDNLYEVAHQLRERAEVLQAF